MKPLLFASSMLFLLLPFFISIMIPTSLGANDGRFTNCSSTFSCGRNISNLKYPFWGDNRSEYCGLPDFHLKCENNTPHIIIQSIKYRILDFQWASQSLTLARDDYSHSICPIEYKNNSFDPTTFKYVDGVANITFHYDCTSDDVLPRNGSFGENCTRDDGTDVFVSYALGLVYASNCKSVVMAVFHSQAEGVAANGVQAALDDGFGLQWMVNNSQCERCSQSGGECGYNKDDGRFSCFCQDGPHKTSCSQGSSESSKKLDWRPRIAIGISAGVVGIAIISVLIICYLKKHVRIKGKRTLKETRAFHHHNLETLMKDTGSLAPKRYSYSEVKKMTKSFSDKLGQGGYGVVYKASLPDGRLVAVKVISESKGSGEEFINEVESISRTSHVNIVTLLGFCYERNKKALIYEYMPNGSLDKFIYKNRSFNAICSLEWMTMYKISIGVARGLEYLHRGCNTRILHFDIKPQNILLDEDFCPKISDFGLAKICQKKESVVSILGARGTVGFIAPEVFSKAFGRVSHKSDVYSYGMLVLEMVGGRKNYDSGRLLSDEMYFPDWIYRDLEQGNNSFASSLSITEEENEMVRKMTLVSLWCIQTDPSDRPSMSKVVEMLEGPFQSLLFPPKPSLHSPTRSSLQFLDGSTIEILETNSVSTWKDASIEC